MRIRIGLWILWGAVIINGCQANPTGDEILLERTPSARAAALETVTTLATTEGEIQMIPSQPTPNNPELQNLIASTIQDLATRLSIPSAEILLVEATPVEWSDSSLGCPQEGMSYLQVITPGYRIVLQTSSQTYEYHTNRTGYFVFCGNRVPPITPQR